MKIHPSADIFPMMSDEELQDLAADIKENGLIHPIITDASGDLIVDGRNRLAACKIAGVKPTYEKLNGKDPLAYIVSANLARRNLTKGQQAMALAMMFPEPHSAKNVNKINNFTRARLSQARTVLRHSPEIAADVIKGTRPLNDAVEIVQANRQQSTSHEAQLERLRKEAPDLAELVDEERMKLPEALAAMSERSMELERVRQGGRTSVEELRQFAGRVACVEMAINAGEKKLLKSSLVEEIAEAAKRLQHLLKNQ